MARFTTTKVSGVLKGPDGNEYYMVWKRVKDFRAKYSIDDGWGLVSQLVVVKEMLVMRGEIHNPEGRVLASGISDPVPANPKPHLIKKYETQALGRAIAAAGFVSDGSYASADEVIDALGGSGGPEIVDPGPMPVANPKLPERTSKKPHCPECGKGPPDLQDYRQRKADGDVSPKHPDIKCTCGMAKWLTAA